MSIETKTVSEKIEFENEGDVYSYSAFTFDNFYPSELGIYKRNLFKLTGVRKKDLHSIIETGLVHLNQNSAKKYALADFVIGFMRSDPINGYEYKLLFKYNSSCCDAIQIQRPLSFLKIKQLDHKSKKINFVVPLNTEDSNLAKLKRFIKIFIDIALKKDNLKNSLNLIIGYSNEKEIKKYTKLIDEFSKNFDLNFIKIVVVKMEKFSRSELLNLGSKDLKPDELMFFCDIDIAFNEIFLETCRSNTIKGEQVYFPILFSYYNPVNLEKIRNLVSSQKDLTIDKYSGYFRDVGFGMMCVYKQDFHQIGGFNNWKSREWGGEDLFLFRKFLKSNLKVFRAISPGLFHIYHPKKCDEKLIDQQHIKDCLNAKIFNEASHETLGTFFFNYRKLINKIF